MSVLVKKKEEERLYGHETDELFSNEVIFEENKATNIVK